MTGIEYFQANWLHWHHTPRYDLILGAEITYEEALHYLMRSAFSTGTWPLAAPYCWPTRGDRRR